MDIVTSYLKMAAEITECSTDEWPSQLSLFLLKRFMGILFLIPLYLFIMDSLNSVSVGMVSDVL